MRFKKICIAGLLLMSVACTNKEVDESYKQMQYTIIRGLNASQEGKYSEAIGHFTKAYQMNPTEIYVLRELGYNYGASEDYKMAEYFYLEALKVSPNDPKVIFNLGTIYFNQKRFVDALGILSKINIENTTLEIKSLKAYTLYNLNKNDEAYIILKEIENSKKDDLYFAKIYGDILLKMGKLSELHPYVSNLYKEKSNNPEIVYIYGKHLHYNLGKSKEALETFERYIIDYGVYKELNIEAANISCDVQRFDLGKKYLDLLPDKIKYEEEYLKTAIRVYTGLKDETVLKELNTAYKKITKE